MQVSDLADLILWLPAGSAFWMDIGGPASVASEDRQLRRIVYWLQVLDYRERGSKGQQPKPDPEPPYASQRRDGEEAMRRKATAHMRRQHRPAVG